MKKVYRCFSGSAAHQWVERNKKPHEEHLLGNDNYAMIANRLEGAFNTMGVAVERERVPCGNDTWRWAWTYNVYHSDNDGGGREEIDLVRSVEVRA